MHSPGICPVRDVLPPAGRQPGCHYNGLTPKAQMPGSSSTRGTEVKKSSVTTKSSELEAQLSFCFTQPLLLHL